MIKLIDHTNTEIAEKIFDVFQVSYAIEAEILNAKDFPPLKRPLKDYINCPNDFFGYYVNEELAAVTEILNHPDYVHIQSLVVSPKFFKRGIGKALVNFVFENYESNTFIVETGLDNIPACNLYKKLGFKEIKQYDTVHGIRKVRFQRVS